MNRTTKRGILIFATMLALMLALIAIGALAGEPNTALGAQTTATVSFDPGTGTGQMGPAEVSVGSEYELPECTFTHANEERTFYKWSVGNELMDPGDEIAVNGDTTVTALWKYTSRYEKDDHSVDKSTTEVLGVLTIKDMRTGEEKTLTVYDEVTASSFTEPTNPTVNAMVNEAKAALTDEAEEQAGGSVVTVISETVSDPEITKTSDDRTYMNISGCKDEAGDYYNAMFIDGSYLHRWCRTVTLEAEYTSPEPTDHIPIYRLYNKKTSEHLYTTDQGEYDQLPVITNGDWVQEGVAWNAPAKGATGASPVWRLYNKGLGDHHYTANAGERDALVTNAGWKVEGVAFYTAQEGGDTIGLYRLYNGRLKKGQHHYTASATERDVLVANAGWKYEGVSFWGWK